MTRKSQEILSSKAAEGIMPLEYLLTVMRDEGMDPSVRLDAAKSAAPYCHPRLASQKVEIERRESYEDMLLKLAKGEWN